MEVSMHSSIYGNIVHYMTCVKYRFNILASQFVVIWLYSVMEVSVVIQSTPYQVEKLPILR